MILFAALTASTTRAAAQPAEESSVEPEPIDVEAVDVEAVDVEVVDVEVVDVEAVDAGAGPADAVDVVVTGTRTVEAQAKAPVRTDVVTRNEIRRRGATNVGEALETQLGVEVNAGAYGFIGGPSAIQIQGFDRERVLILEDGERVAGDVGGAVDLAAISIADVSRIEIVGGPSSVLYGASALGGVVNIITQPPQLEGPSGELTIEGRAPRLGASSRGHVAYRAGESWISAEGALTAREGVPVRDDAPDLALPGGRRSLLGVRAGTFLTRELELRGRVRWIRDDLTGLETEQLPGLGTFFVDLPEETDRIAVQLEETVHLGEATIRLAGSRQWYVSDTSRDRRDSPVDDLRERHYVLQTFETTASLFEDGALSPLIGLRAEVERFDQRLERSVASTDGIDTESLVEVEPTQLTSVAAFGQLRWQPTPSIIILPGARVEAHTRYGTVLVPRLATSWAFAAWGQLRVAGGRGFRAPSAKEYGFFFDHTALGYRVIGNDDLDPETSWGVTSDLELEPTRGLRARIGVFANWVDDLIDVDFTGSQAPGVDDYTYVNVGKARTFGGQLDLSYRVTPELRAEAGYSYLWTRNDTLERPLVGRPPHTVVVGLTASLPADFEMSVRYRASTDSFVDEDIRSPGYSRLLARIARPLWPSSELYLGGTNLLDSRNDPDRAGDQRPRVGYELYAGLTSAFPWEEDG